MTTYEPPVLTVEGIKRIIQAAGLWMDKDLEGYYKDRWGPLLDIGEGYRGFVTCLPRDPTCGFVDQVRRTSSIVALHDGTDRCVYRGDWFACDDKGAYKRCFKVQGASFALVERQYPLYRSYIPERIFVYPYSPKFDLQNITLRLNEYRRLRPPRVILCETTP